jgi:hypothetical protein
VTSRRATATHRGMCVRPMRNDAVPSAVAAPLHMISHTRAPGLAPRSPAASFFFTRKHPRDHRRQALFALEIMRCGCCNHLRFLRKSRCPPRHDTPPCARLLPQPPSNKCQPPTPQRPHPCAPAGSDTKAIVPQQLLCILLFSAAASALPISASGPRPAPLAPTEFAKWKVETGDQVPHDNCMPPGTGTRLALLCI